MKTIKKTSSKPSAKTTKKAVDNIVIENKKQSQPTQREVAQTQDKTAKSDKVFKYVTTFPRLTLIDNKEIAKLLKSEIKEVTDRFAERQIKVNDILKLSKYGHKQLLNGKVKSNSMKFYLTLKGDKKLCLNFGNYESNKK